MSIEEEYQDVLQNIESAIVKEYRQNPNLSDYDVDDALKTLIRFYRGEQDGKSLTLPKLAERPKVVFDSVKIMCELRLGREQIENVLVSNGIETITHSELIDCLRRIEKSVQRWNKQGGRQGYLNFISKFI